MTGAALAGVRVVECDSFVAGPSACLAFAQMGADVIRVDPLPRPADYLRWPLGPTGDSLFWSALNSGKRSVLIDMKCEQGKQLTAALITAPGADAGIFVDNTVGRDWLSFEALSARRRDLIHSHIEGRPDGAPAVDYTVNPEVGIPMMTGTPDHHSPVNSVVPTWDLLTGATVVSTTVAAIRTRERTGLGAYYAVALSDIALTTLANLGWISEAEMLGGGRPRQGNHIYGTYGTSFATSDHTDIMIAAVTAGQWKAIVAATGTSDVFSALETVLAIDFAREADRYRNRHLIDGVLAPWFAARPLAFVASTLNQHRVLWSQYRELSDVAADFRSQSTASSVLANAGAGSSAPIVGRPAVRLNGGAYGGIGESPRLGAHTEIVLSEVLGITQAEYGRLTHDRVVLHEP